MKVAVYLRQSQDRDGNEYGIERQRADVMAMVQRHGWTVVGEFIDNDTSATKRKPRKAFEEMLSAVQRGEVDVIAARHLDRLLRRLTELERVLELCEANGARIVTASDGIDTSTDAGRLVARIVGSVAQGEVERKSARQISATQQAAGQGRWVGGRRPFGYESDGVTIREDEAKLIRRAYKDVLAGVGTGTIARQWNRAGMRTPQGQRDGTEKRWDHTNVRTVLVNPRYAGLRRHRTAAQRPDIRKNPTLGITGAADWPAIVTEDVWRAAVDVLVDPSRKKAPTGPQLLLSGVARCGVCGDRVHAGARRRGVPTYRCRSGAHVSRNAERVNRVVEDAALARLTRPDALQLLTPKVRTDVAPLIEESRAARARLDSVADEFADGVVTADQLKRITAKLNARLADLEAQIAEAGRLDALAPVLHATDMAAAWAQLDDARKRGIIDVLMVVTIELVGAGQRIDGVRIDWK